MSFEGITTAAEAVQYIQANPNMSIEDLRALAAQMDVSVSENAVKIAYSGSMTDGTSNYALVQSLI